MADEPGAQRSRTVLGAMLLVLFAAVLLALWFLVVGNGNDKDTATTTSALPTSLPLPTATAVPTAGPTATPVPTVAPTPLPVGLSLCDPGTAPDPARTYLVDTNSAPLNHRASPSASADLVGSYASGTGGWQFEADCLVNESDGYTWWRIRGSDADAWVASEFLRAE